MILIQSIGFGVVTASLIAIGAMGFTVQFGLTNVFNLSYGSVMTVSAFVAYLLQSRGLNIWLSMLSGAIAGALLTWLIGRTVFKLYARRGAKLFEMVMVTLGLALIIDYAVNVISRDSVYEFTFSQGATIKLGPVDITRTQLVLVGVAALIFASLVALLKLTKLGKALRAMAVDPSLARSCGIPTGRIVNATWLISGFLCGLAGVVYVINSQNINYDTGELFLPLVLASAILGGAGSPAGAVLASLIMGIVYEIVSAYGGSLYSTVAAFGVLIVVLLARPSSVLNQTARKMELTL